MRFGLPNGKTPTRNYMNKEEIIEAVRQLQLEKIKPGTSSIFPTDDMLEEQTIDTLLEGKTLKEKILKLFIK